VSVQAEVLNLLRDVRELEGLTYILVSHDLGVIAHTCDRLAVMNHGRILEEMPVADLTANRPKHPCTQQLFDASAGYDRRLAHRALDYGDQVTSEPSA
jgi:peptide/nickel transport system ATP-binding protein